MMNKNIHFRELFSKRNLTIIFALLLLILAFIYAFSRFKENKIQKKEQKLVKVDFVKDNNEEKDERFLDSDNDGAYDWVENLWPELDPHNPDSDGDGVLDGKYIKQKMKIRARERQGVSNPDSNLSESEKLGRGLYQALFVIQQSGASLDDETADKIADNVSEYISDLSLGSKLYLRDDIKKVLDNKENSLKYMKEMKNLFKQYPVQTSDIKLILEATKNPEQYRAQLEEAATRYRLYAQELSSLEVPRLVAGRHVELLNAIEQLAGALENLSSDKRDDVITLSSLVQVRKILDTVVDANTHIEKYFNIITTKGIFDE